MYENRLREGINSRASPMAYKPPQEIIDKIKDTVDIVDIIKPVYNFKASE